MGQPTSRHTEQPKSVGGYRIHSVMPCPKSQPCGTVRAYLFEQTLHSGNIVHHIMGTNNPAYGHCRSMILIDYASGTTFNDARTKLCQQYPWITVVP